MIKWFLTKEDLKISTQETDEASREADNLCGANTLGVGNRYLGKVVTCLFTTIKWPDAADTITTLHTCTKRLHNNEQAPFRFVIN